MNSKELFDDGQLKAAVDAALAEVKAAPTDTARRQFLAELLCFVGDWERADRQLETIAHQDPSLHIGISRFRQLIRCEVARHEVYQQGRLPEFFSPVSELLKCHLNVVACLRDHDRAAASEHLAEAQTLRGPVSGVADGLAFDDWRDLDDLAAPMFEVFSIDGAYYWVPVEQVESIEFRPPQKPRDLLWRAAHLVARGGPDGHVFLPTRYPSTTSSDDDQLRLGLATDWQNPGEGPVLGVGLRMFLIGDRDQSILQVKKIGFHENG